MVFMRGSAHDVGMDAFELTRPILTPGRRFARPVPPSSSAARTPAPDGFAQARRFVNQLPLGAWVGPPFDGRRWNAGAAARELERALLRVAAAHGVSVSSDDAPGEIARRLVRARAIVAPAADAAVALLDGLRVGDTPSGDGAKLAERLVGYLDFRALLRPARFWR
jgi:hypothetical protein